MLWAQYALFISEALFGDWGEDSLRGQKKSTDSIESMLIWRRVRDLNPRWGISPHTISSRAPYTNKCLQTAEVSGRWSA